MRRHTIKQDKYAYSNSNFHSLQMKICPEEMESERRRKRDWKGKRVRENEKSSKRWIRENGVGERGDKGNSAISFI